MTSKSKTAADKTEIKADDDKGETKHDQKSEKAKALDPAQIEDKIAEHAYGDLIRDLYARSNVKLPGEHARITALRAEEEQADKDHEAEEAK